MTRADGKVFVMEYFEGKQVSKESIYSVDGCKISNHLYDMNGEYLGNKVV